MKTSAKSRARNRSIKTQLRSAMRNLHAMTDRQEASRELNTVTSLLDRAAGAGAIHQRTADRHKSRLAKRISTLP